MSVQHKDEWHRLPGLFRRFEFEQVIDTEHEFYVEQAGHDDSGVCLYRIYHRPGGGPPPNVPGAPMAAVLRRAA